MGSNLFNLDCYLVLFRLKTLFILSQKKQDHAKRG